MGWAAWAGLVYLFHSCNIMGGNILGCLGYLIFFFLEQILHLTKHLIKTCIQLGLDLGHYGINVLLHLVFPVHQFIHLITGTGGMVHPFEWISLLHLFQKYGTQSVSCWIVGFWNIFFIFWLNSSWTSLGSGRTSLGSPGSSWSRVSPELMELVSSSRLYFASWTAFLLCSILELPVAGSCRTTSVVVGLHQ